jgi:protein TonB
VFENETEDPKPNSKPPYLFLIPVVLGILGFIGYQTVRMGTDTSVERSPYAVDTSVAQAVVENGVITVHASTRRPSAPHGAPPKRVAINANEHKNQPSPTPAHSSAPTVAPSTSPEPRASATTISESTVAEKPHRKAHRAADASSDGIANQPVPHIERPIAARLVSTTQANENATAPPDTDVPLVAHHAPASAATAAPVAAAPAPTAKPVVVAQAPVQSAPQAAEAAGPINAADRIVEAKMSYAAAPDYPDMARDEGVRGTSVVLVTVDGKGSIMHMSIASSSGNGSLDRAALAAARSSQYVAPRIDGKPAIETYRVTYDFAP